MASDVPRSFYYAGENVRFFVEEMICYITRRNGMNFEFSRPEHLERLRAVAVYTFTPSIGDAIIYVALEQRERILSEVQSILNYLRTLRRSVRGEVLYSSLVVMGIRILNEGNDEHNIFVLMAIVAHLCFLFGQSHHSSLTDSAVSALEFILNRVIRGGFPRTIIRLTTLSLRMRILHPALIG